MTFEEHAHFACVYSETGHLKDAESTMNEALLLVACTLDIWSTCLKGTNCISCMCTEYVQVHIK